MIYNTMWR